MKGHARNAARMRRQSGATAVEFALVFPIILAVMYCGLVYSYVFVLQQAINFAAQQGAQAAVAVVPVTDLPTTQAAQQAQASLAAKASISWMPADQIARFTPSSVSSCGAGQVLPSNGFAEQTTFTLSGGSGGSLFPTLLSLPLVGTIPVLPVQLTACAVVLT